MCKYRSFGLLITFYMELRPILNIINLILESEILGQQNMSVTSNKLKCFEFNTSILCIKLRQNCIWS